MPGRKIIFVFLFAAITVYGQQDTTYSLTTELGIGYSHYNTDLSYSGLDKNGFSGSIRVMWNPEYLLSLGIETGYHYLYSVEVNDLSTEFGNTSFSASMHVIPVFIVIAMEITPEIRITASSGMYILTNEGNIFNDDLESSQLSIGAHAGISYMYPLNKMFSLGGELKYSYISKLQDSVIALQLVVQYKLLEW